MLAVMMLAILLADVLTVLLAILIWVSLVVVNLLASMLLTGPTFKKGLRAVVQGACHSSYLIRYT